MLKRQRTTKRRQRVRRRSNRKRLSLLAHLKRALARGKNRRTLGGAEPELAAAPGEAAAAAAAALTPGESGAAPRRGRLRLPRVPLKGVLATLAYLVPLGAAVLAFATPLLGVQAYHYVMEAGHFFVRDVLVEGNQRVDYDAIRQYSGLGPGAHTLALDLDQVAEDLERHPWIAHATVERELPDRLLIRVVEHTPAAYVALGELFLVNQAGEVFKPVEPGDELPLPIVSGIDPDAFADAAHAKIAQADIRAAVNLAHLYDEVGLGVRWPIAEVRIEPGQRATLVLSDLGTEVALGAGPYREKLYRLEWVLENLRREKKAAEYVLLDAPPSDGRVVVRADIAPSREQLAQRAAMRAQEAFEGAQQAPPAGGGDAANGATPAGEPTAPGGRDQDSRGVLPRLGGVEGANGEAAAEGPGEPAGSTREGKRGESDG